MQDTLIKLIHSVESIMVDEFGTRLIIKDGDTVYRLGIFPGPEMNTQGQLVLQDVTDDVDEIDDVHTVTYY